MQLALVDEEPVELLELSCGRQLEVVEQIDGLLERRVTGEISYPAYQRRPASPSISEIFVSAATISRSPFSLTRPG
jgi:hypothetical protein